MYATVVFKTLDIRQKRVWLEVRIKGCVYPLL